MKGLSMEYLALSILFLAVIILGIGMITHFQKQSPKIEQPKYDVRYLCAQLNGSQINFDEFKDVLYGFLTSQCTEFEANVSSKITVDDIKSFVNSWSDIRVVLIDECSLPSVNSNTIYINFEEIEINHKIYLKRKEIMDSDILICEIT